MLDIQEHLSNLGSIYIAGRNILFLFTVGEFILYEVVSSAGLKYNKCYTFHDCEGHQHYPVGHSYRGSVRLMARYMAKGYGVQCNRCHADIPEEIITLFLLYQAGR